MKKLFILGLLVGLNTTTLLYAGKATEIENKISNALSCYDRSRTGIYGDGRRFESFKLEDITEKNGNLIATGYAYYKVAQSGEFARMLAGLKSAPTEDRIKAVFKQVFDEVRLKAVKRPYSDGSFGNYVSKQCLD